MAAQVLDFVRGYHLVYGLVDQGTVALSDHVDVDREGSLAHAGSADRAEDLGMLDKLGTLDMDLLDTLGMSDNSGNLDK